ncbi:MAG: alpha/beta hydrolase family protein [Gordonia sp. (in: high G+C Gram-positive bacteria)]|uniref:alpha/beta hydrolase n=1 Tax=Gordonia sp. (in: high G+C Gram-positive bacteria) TaxID=84139 RepID=UPI0039E24A37
MRFGKNKLRGGSRLTAIAVTVATTVGLLGSVIGAGTAEAAAYREFRVNSCGMPSNSALGRANPNGTVKVQTWYRRQNTRTVILLDGMRARYDRSGWAIETNARLLADRGVNVVMPVGGPNSFYTDWDAPSNFNGQQARYRWGCVLNQRIVPALRSRGYASKGGRYALMGISMGGNAALTNAAQNRSRYYAAASLSGYNFLTSPGMRTMLRVAMLDVQPGPWNVDSMWGAPWSPRWPQNDPTMLINRMHGLKLYIGSGNGMFGRYNYPQNVGDDLFKGTPLELLALTQAASFEAFARAQGLNPMTHYANGTHAWGYWQDMLWNAHSRGFFR